LARMLRFGSPRLAASVPAVPMLASQIAAG
jgi:hypothetical protein